MIPQNFYNIQRLLDKNDNSENDPYNEVWQYLSVQLKSYFDILNKGIVLSDNMRGKILTCEFTAINTDTTFNHGLNFTPTGYIPISYTAAMRIYTGDSAWDSSNIVLKSDTAGSAQILVF